MAPPIIDEIVEDENYASSEDEDFVPDEAPAAVASASESESEAEGEGEGEAPTEAKKGKPATKRKRAKQPAGEDAEDIGFENSGDEAIIGKGLKKQRRRRRRGEEEEEDEGGEGGFVKTRRMAAAAEEERAPLADTKNATVDVDALWASMVSGSPKQPTEHTPLPPSDTQALDTVGPVSKTAAAAASALTTLPGPNGDDTVTIQRTYNFAGKVHTETKIVPRDSAEARLYLASNPSPTTDAPTSTSPPRRPTKLARRSMFEPVIDTGPPRSDLKLGVGMIRERLVAQQEVEKGRKLNTVEKSKMDWAGFVDKEGIREELEVAEKGKGSYLQRKEFLERVEGKREEVRRATVGKL
ncbi:swr complex subunit [Pseudogymnoascus verrucosus]|uniref:SWR1-complex protein 5 n=1 Tax=Pseudogymnoascus verrucosus TaxID=342668 RepID=A0A2P2SVU1_9PEZI|nr:swr complex subunit [Pseudogymnoascus verrucosus]OBU00971.1 swr complex subunit [Pseudogymnoascus verrucosus]